MMMTSLPSTCPCAGATLEKFVQPAILATLAREPLYGYRIAEALAEMPVVKGGNDMAGLYRTLKTMERRGLLVGEWEASEKGPDRRLYRMTPSGADCLRRWLQTLGEHAKAVVQLEGEVRRACARLSSVDAVGTEPDPP
jgi:DNA-binding PadR family transcriptional regulator